MGRGGSSVCDGGRTTAAAWCARPRWAGGGAQVRTAAMRRLARSSAASSALQSSSMPPSSCPSPARVRSHVRTPRVRRPRLGSARCITVRESTRACTKEKGCAGSIIVATATPIRAIVRRPARFGFVCVCVCVCVSVSVSVCVCWSLLPVEGRLRTGCCTRAAASAS